MDERQWVQAIQRGDKRYLQDIAEKYYDDIFRFCAFQTGSREDAYDMAQETFLRFIRYVEGYHERNLKGYLLTVAMNVCRDHLRRKGREDAVTVRYGEDWQWDGAVASASGRAGRSRKSGAMAPDGGEWKRRDGADVPGGGEWKQGTAWKPGLAGVGAEGNRAADPERHAVEADVHQRLIQALAQLPDMQREAILLHYLYDMKYREIGRLTDVAVSTVKSRVRQGMEKLQGILRREDFLD